MGLLPIMFRRNNPGIRPAAGSRFPPQGLPFFGFAQGQQNLIGLKGLEI